MTEARFKLAILRSEALLTFYQAERRSGADVLTAHERMMQFARRFDAFEAEQATVAREMERNDV